MRPTITNRSLGPLRARKKEITTKNAERRAQREFEQQRIRRAQRGLFTIMEQIGQPVAREHWETQVLRPGESYEEAIAKIEPVNPVLVTLFPENAMDWLMESSDRFYSIHDFLRQDSVSHWWALRGTHIFPDWESSGFGYAYHRDLTWLGADGLLISSTPAELQAAREALYQYKVREHQARKGSGKSAYELAVEKGGFVGTEAEFIASLSNVNKLPAKKPDPVRDGIVVAACAVAVVIAGYFVTLGWKM